SLISSRKPSAMAFPPAPNPSTARSSPFLGDEARPYFLREERERAQRLRERHIAERKAQHEVIDARLFDGGAQLCPDRGGRADEAHAGRDRAVGRIGISRGDRLDPIEPPKMHETP